MKRTRLVLALALAGVLSACGDSGPGILNGGGEIIGGEPVIIDDTNVQVVAATGAQAAITRSMIIWTPTASSAI